MVDAIEFVVYNGCIGIDPVFQRKLNATGIRTFGQLAQTPNDRLAAILTLPAWQKIGPARWVQDAARLAGL